MSILDNVTPVNKTTVTNTIGPTNLIDVTKLPLYTDGNELTALELLVKLDAAKAARPKLDRASTPATIVSNIPKINSLYEAACGKPLPANELSNIREVTVSGKIVSIQNISEGILSKFFKDGYNTKPDSALAYAEYLHNLASTLVTYADELQLAKDAYLKLNKYNYSTVQELEELYEAQFMTEEAFNANGSTWDTENERRGRDATTDRMYKKFAAFEAYEKEQAAKA